MKNLSKTKNIKIIDLGILKNADLRQEIDRNIVIVLDHDVNEIHYFREGTGVRLTINVRGDFDESGNESLLITRICGSQFGSNFHIQPFLGTRSNNSAPIELEKIE